MTSIQEKVARYQQQWIEAVTSMKPDKVVPLYDQEKGTLLGTVDTNETGVRVGAHAILEYFKHFLDRDDVTPHFPPVKEQAVQDYDGTISASGYYTFNLTGHDGSQNVANAKFTYIYDQEGKILLHNSGLTPEGITKA
jgi:hypothetical protein